MKDMHNISKTPKEKENDDKQLVIASVFEV